MSPNRLSPADCPADAQSPAHNGTSEWPCHRTRAPHMEQHWEQQHTFKRSLDAELRHEKVKVLKGESPIQRMHPVVHDALSCALAKAALSPGGGREGLSTSIERHGNCAMLPFNREVQALVTRPGRSWLPSDEPGRCKSCQQADLPDSQHGCGGDQSEPFWARKSLLRRDLWHSWSCSRPCRSGSGRCGRPDTNFGGRF